MDDMRKSIMVHVNSSFWHYDILDIVSFLLFEHGNCFKDKKLPAMFDFVYFSVYKIFIELKQKISYNRPILM